MAKSTRSRSGGSRRRTAGVTNVSNTITPAQVVMIDFAAQGRQQFLEQMAEYRKNPIDRSKRPGGYFLNADGSGAHNANGDPVPVRPEDKDHAEELRNTASFNRFGTPLGESDDVETTLLSDAMQGQITRATGFRQTASDTGVRVPAGQDAPRTQEEIAEEIDARHERLQQLQQQQLDELRSEQAALAAESPRKSRRSGGRRPKASRSTRVAEEPGSRRAREASEGTTGEATSSPEL